MTLIELVVTITIMSLLTVAAVPSLRGLSARQSLRAAQRQAQSLLYRVQQLALAPPVNESQSYDTIGYGLMAYPTHSLPPANLGGCRIDASNDFLALVKFVRLRDSSGAISAVLNSQDPTATANGCQVDASNTPNDFYVLPKQVQMSSSSVPGIQKPWLVPVPLQATGERYGDLMNYAPSNEFTNPLASNATDTQAELILKHTTVNVSRDPLCHGVLFSHDTSGISVTQKRVENCQ